MPIKIALAGNPNSGKTTLFNALTGSSARVGNWPGVTVEKKEGKIIGQKDVWLQDLPGIYSLSPYTLEEVVTREYLVNDKPDAIINIVDATNLERNLYLTTQLMELGIPVVIALNMMDLVRKRGDSINSAVLKEKLGCDVIEISALKESGTEYLIKRAISMARDSKKNLPKKSVFSEPVESALAYIEKVIAPLVDHDMLRWYSIKLFERDERAQQELGIGPPAGRAIERAISACEKSEDDNSEGIITNERYSYIAGIIPARKKPAGIKMTASDKIDLIVTDRVLALPIFAAVMFLVYYLSISTVGTIATEWVNKTFFGEAVPAVAEAFLDKLGANEVVSGLILHGIVPGVGAVLGFLPQMLVLFLCLAILEDSGYMARVAFIMDRVFRRFGLSGKSFIPIMIGTGCGVPGIMSARTIENESNRKITIITTTFIPCGAKLPIISMIAGAVFGGSALVSVSAYFMGIAAILCTGVILKKFKAFAGNQAPFVMELPTYRLPGLKGVFRYLWEKGSSFVRRAGTVILLSSVVIWLLGAFDTSLRMAGAEDSVLANIGRTVAPFFGPLGWGDWRAAVSTITGLIAKENIVSTIGVLYGGLNGAVSRGDALWDAVAQSFNAIQAYSFLAFNLLCAPCVAAVGAIRREMGSIKWTFIAVGYQTALAYGVSLVIYNMGMFFTQGVFSYGTVAAILVVLVFLNLLIRPNKYSGGKVRLNTERSKVFRASRNSNVSGCGSCGGRSNGKSVL